MNFNNEFTLKKSDYENRNGFILAVKYYLKRFNGYNLR